MKIAHAPSIHFLNFSVAPMNLFQCDLPVNLIRFWSISILTKPKTTRMTSRQAACNCGQLHLVCEGEPKRISICHCLACQRRSGSVFGVQAWFGEEQVVSVAGTSTEFARISGVGRSLTFHFCPTCGSTVFWKAEAFPGLVAVAVGAFADPNFPAPSFSVWERRRHEWIDHVSEAAIQHSK